MGYVNTCLKDILFDFEEHYNGKAYKCNKNILNLKMLCPARKSNAKKTGLH